jgi:MFS family permease
MKIRINIDIKVGRLVKYFVLSDLFFLGGWGFIDPVFSVFIVEKIVGGTLAVVGISAAIYWILRSVLQVPIANYLDRTPGEKDDFMALITGLFLAGFSAIAFCVVTTVWGLYVVQAVHALAFALYFASWPTIFSRHLDKDRISFDWTIDSTVSGIAAGVTGLLSGIIAATLGYNAVFIAAGILSFIAAIVLMAVPDIILPKPVGRAGGGATAAAASSVVMERKNPESAEM